MHHHLATLIALACAGASSFAAAQSACRADSGLIRTPVVELYTSEGCSSCPPADQWLSRLKPAAAQGQVVAQAFHVGYWDYIGWVDRFATPAHTARQRELAQLNGQSGIYTPQLVRDGRDWRDYGAALAPARDAPGARLHVERTEADAFQARVEPAASGPWAAYWTVTEHGHSSRVKAGENAGAYLQHDFVVRQYVPLGTYSGAQTLRLRAVPGDAGHARQVNLVVFEPRTGKPLQALSLACPA